jgi:hypothetical protein
LKGEAETDADSNRAGCYCQTAARVVPAKINEDSPELERMMVVVDISDQWQIPVQARTRRRGPGFKKAVGIT